MSNKTPKSLNINLTDPQIDRLVLASLKEQYRLQSMFSNGPDESLLNALNSIISLYSSVDEWRDWIKERKDV